MRLCSLVQFEYIPFVFPLQVYNIEENPINVVFIHLMLFNYPCKINMYIYFNSRHIRSET